MTVRKYFPFSMGKTTYIDTFTLEPVIEHPILDIGSSYSMLKSHIEDWLDEHCTEWDIGLEDGEYYIDFPTEEDVTLFLLRWS